MIIISRRKNYSIRCNCLKNKFANKKEFHFVENISLRYTAFHILHSAVILSKTGCIPVKAVNSVFYIQVRKNRRRFVCGSLLARQRPTLAGGNPQLPSALESLTSVFGMGTGVTFPPSSPDLNDKNHYNKVSIAYQQELCDSLKTGWEKKL